LIGGLLAYSVGYFQGQAAKTTDTEKQIEAEPDKVEEKPTEENAEPATELNGELGG
jgi:hypothetical protein